MVVIRMKRYGRKNLAFFRIEAQDKRQARDSLTIEDLGFYDPRAKDAVKQLSIKKERIEYWLSVGAKASQSVEVLLKKNGVVVPTPKKKVHPRPKPKAGRRKPRRVSTWDIKQKARGEKLAKKAAEAAKAAKAAAKAEAEAAKAAAETAKAAAETAKAAAETAKAAEAKPDGEAKA